MIKTALCRLAALTAAAFLAACTTTTDQLVKAGSADLLSTALTLGLDPNEKTSDGRTLLTAATLDGDVERVTLLLDRGADADLADSSDFDVPLYYALRDRKDAIAGLLFARGADASKIRADHALEIACSGISGKDPRFADPALLSNLNLDTTAICPGADVSLPYLSHRLGHGMQAVVAAGGDINAAMGRDGMTPLVYAIYHDAAMVELLLNQGADPNGLNLAAPPLWHALKASNKQAEQQLQARGVSEKHIASALWVRLVCERMEGRQAVDQVLLDLALRQNAKDANCEKTPVAFVAVAHGDEQVLKQLRKRGVNLGTQRSETGRSLAQEAIASKQFDVFDWLAEAGAAQQIGHEELLKLAASGRTASYAAGLRISSDAERYELLCHFSGQENVDASQVNGALTGFRNLDRPCRSGSTPLQYAAAAGSQQMVSLLTLRGASAKFIRYADIKHLISESDATILLLLRKAGLPASIEVGAKVESDCKSAAYDYSQTAIAQPFLAISWKLFQKFERDDGARAELLNQYRKCLADNLPRVASAKGYPFYRHSQESRPRIDGTFFGVAKVKTIEALTYLASRELNQQNSFLAQKAMKEAFGELNQASVSFEEAAEEYVAYQEAEIERKMEAAERRQLLGIGASIIGGAFMGSQGVDVETSIDFATDNMLMFIRDYEQQMEEIRSIEIDVPSTPELEQLDDDGVRLFVSRFGSYAAAGVLGSNNSYDHTNRIVRVMPLGCTGAILSTGQILTAQHCIRHDDGSYVKSIAVRWEYLDVVPRSGGSIERRYKGYRGGWRVETSRGFYDDDWRHDWAILTPLNKDIVPDWMKWGLYLATDAQVDSFVKSNGSYRISVAGYSAHLNNGRFLTMDWGCSFMDVARGILLHRCKGWKGDSGAPIIAASGPFKNAILAVHAFGPDIDREQLRKNPRLAPATHRGGVTVVEIQRQIAVGESRVFEVAED